MRERLLLWGAARGGRVARSLVEVPLGSEGWKATYFFASSL